MKEFYAKYPKFELAYKLARKFAQIKMSLKGYVSQQELAAFIDTQLISEHEKYALDYVVKQSKVKVM
jgi:uncharacterized membrane protein YukC